MTTALQTRRGLATSGVTSCSLIVTSLIVTSLMTGCLGPRPDTRRYYGLGPEALPSRESKAPLTGGLVVPTFEVQSTHDRQRMCERVGPVEVSFPRDHLWVDRPQRLLTQRMVTYLQGAGLFARVATTFDAGHPQWVLRGTLLAAEVLPKGDTWSTRLALRLALRDAKTGQVVWARSWDLKRGAKSNDHAAAAQAISRSYGQALAEVSKGLKEAVTKRESLTEPAPATQ